MGGDHDHRPRRGVPWVSEDCKSSPPIAPWPARCRVSRAPCWPLMRPRKLAAANLSPNGAFLSVEMRLRPMCPHCAYTRLSSMAFAGALHRCWHVLVAHIGYRDPLLVNTHLVVHCGLRGDQHLSPWCGRIVDEVVGLSLCMAARLSLGVRNTTGVDLDEPPHVRLCDGAVEPHAR